MERSYACRPTRASLDRSWFRRCYRGRDGAAVPCMGLEVVLHDLVNKSANTTDELVLSGFQGVALNVDQRHWAMTLCAAGAG